MVSQPYRGEGWGEGENELRPRRSVALHSSSIDHWSPNIDSRKMRFFAGAPRNDVIGMSLLDVVIASDREGARQSHFGYDSLLTMNK